MAKRFIPFFKLPLRPQLPDDPDLSTAKNQVYEAFRYTKEHKALLRSLDLIIIDEISMVRADIIDAIDKLLRVYTGRSSTAFGGVQMLFVGDLFQLEPVVKADEKSILDRYYKSHFFFGGAGIPSSRAGDHRAAKSLSSSRRTLRGDPRPCA